MKVMPAHVISAFESRHTKGIAMDISICMYILSSVAVGFSCCPNKELREWLFHVYCNETMTGITLLANGSFSSHFLFHC